MGRLWGALALILAACACSPSGTGSSSPVADCAVAVRHDGDVYVEAGFSKARDERLGRADLSSCGDLGRDPRGRYFGDHPERVAVWSLRGYDPADVLGMRLNGHVFRVLVAEDLPDAVQREIRRTLLKDRRR